MTQNRRPVPRGSAPQRTVNPQRRPAQPTRRPMPKVSNRRLPYDFLRVALIGVLVIALGIGMQLLWPNGFQLTHHKNADGTETESKTVSEIHSSGPFRINELMSSNQGSFISEDGSTPDWIEISNVGTHAANLEGFSLAKSEKSTNVFTFPALVLQPGESVLIYADSTLRNDWNAELHAPFRLSSQGGTLMLFSTSGTAIDTVNYPALAADTSYARMDHTTWSVSNMSTPGMDNTEASYQTLHTAMSNTGIEISEIVASNTQYAPDENGVAQDYVELHNTTGEAIDLSGWYLSDNTARANKWRIPDGFVLQAGEYRIVYASGLDRADAAHPHANFSLTTEGETVTLADKRAQLADSVTYDLLHKDTAWRKNADGSWSESTPTPNAAN